MFHATTLPDRKRRFLTMPRKSFAFFVLGLPATALLCVAPAFAQSSPGTGKLKIHVDPKQAYVFIDGRAIRDGSQTVKLAAGSHTVGVSNYGYLSKTEKVQIAAGKETELDVALEASGGNVAGPFAALEFKGDPRAAVFLNGTAPAYFVGHVDEFDWDWIWHQRLLVQPGTYHVSVAHKDNTIWNGDVTAKAGQKVIIYLDKNGKMVTKDWKEGNTLGPEPRFHAGIASATVPVAPVTATLNADSGKIACGQSATLKWSSTDAVDTSISGIGSASADGTRSVSPTHDTTYTLTAKGTGGESTKTVTVDVNAGPTATLALSQPEIRYHKIGDKVVEQDSATLRWSASNANSATIDPFGNAGLNGSRTITANPNETGVGPIYEDLQYTITATNACGGTTTKTATLHLVGSIDPPPAATLASLYYPTAYPTRKHPKIGLVASEKAVLTNLATQFKNLEMYQHKANLVIVAHADMRGSRKYNQALSERRAALVKEYLVSKGIRADQLETRAVGKEDQMDTKAVQALQSKDEQRPEKWMAKDKKATWLAYNRRVDIVLEPTGQQSTKMYPNDAPGARILWQRHEPSLKAVSTASSETSASATVANGSALGN
jgi:hypothetical protein